MLEDAITTSKSSAFPNSSKFTATKGRLQWNSFLKKKKDYFLKI